MWFNACSISQLRRYGQLYPGSHVGIRINPGIGSGSHSKTTVGGPNSSFGIWHELVPEILSTAAEFSITIRTIHMHIGSGNDSTLWGNSLTRCLEIVAQIPTIVNFNLGGGYKIDRMDPSHNVDLHALGEEAQRRLHEFHDQTGRQLTIEIEPGTYVMGMAGVMVASVIDVVETSKYKFIKLNCGLNDI